MDYKFEVLFDKMPHPLNRPYQQLAYDLAMESDSKIVIIKMPTGSGKSAIAAQAGYDNYKTMVLTETISLQNQYQDSYNFKMLKGKSHYLCHDDYINQCDICHASKYDKEFCQTNCPYPLDKQEVLSSNHASLNYSKYLLELREFGIVKNFTPSLLVCDEGHNLSNIVCDHVGFSFKWSGKTAQYTNYLEINPASESSTNLGTFVLENILSNLPFIRITRDSSNDEKKKFRSMERLKQRIANTLKLIEYGEQFWYCKSDADEFVLKPLTARFHFDSLFDQADKVILMSATIEPSDLVDIGLTTWDELETLQWTNNDGIKEWITDNLHFIKVPNIWPALLRPIYDLHGPRMGNKSTDVDRKKWVKVMVDRINLFDPVWTGIVHTASKEQSYFLAQQFRQTGRPIYIPRGRISTEEMYKEWQEFYRSNEGAICINWAFWEGVDLGDQQFCIVAKVPFASFGNGYDFARHKFDARASNRRVANKLIQGWGRIRRGIVSHYGANKWVGIADSNYRRVWNYLDDEIKESIRDE